MPKPPRKPHPSKAHVRTVHPSTPWRKPPPINWRTKRPPYVRPRPSTFGGSVDRAVMIVALVLMCAGIALYLTGFPLRDWLESFLHQFQ